MEVEIGSLRGRVRQDHEGQSLRAVLIKLPRGSRLAVSIQEEASGEHFIVRDGTMPGTPFLAEYMKRVDGQTTFDGVAMRRDTLSAHELVLRYRETHDDMDVVGFAGFGNVTMNPRFMTYVEGRLVCTAPDLGDPRASFEKPNPSIVVWQDGTAAFAGVRFELSNHVDKKDPAIFHRHRKWLAEEGLLPGTPGEFRVLVDGKAAARADLSCVIQGPQLVRDGIPVDADGVAAMTREGWFYDLRHVIRFPYVKLEGPEGVVSLGVDVGLERMWTQQGLDQEEVARALRGEVVRVSLDPYNDPNQPYVQIYGQPIGSSRVKETLINQSYSCCSQREQLDRRGQFYMSSSELQIRYEEGIYNHSVLGLSESGELRWLGLAGLGGRVGLTMAETATLAAENGMKDAILIDDGGDVMLNLRGEWVIRSGYKRTRIRGLVIFAAPSPTTRIAERYLPTRLF